MSRRRPPYRAPRRTRSTDSYRLFLDAVLTVACILVILVWACRAR